VPYRWKVLTLVSTAVFLVGLDLFIVNVAFPDIAGDFGGSDIATVSWVLNAYAIVLASLMVPAGRLADLLGRRRVFLAGLVLFALGSALCGIAGSIEMLIASRAVQAAGAACLIPTSLALLLPEFPPRERAAAIGVWAAIGGIAAAFGPPIGGLLVEVSWQLVFYVNVPLAALALGIGWSLLRESRDESSGRPDLVGALVLTLAVGLLALGLVEAPDWGWKAFETIAVLGLGTLGIGAFWARCNRHPWPMVEPALLRVRSYAAANGAGLLFSASFAAMLLANVLFMTSVWGNSIITAGLSLAPGPLMAAAVAVPAGRLVNGFGPRLLATAGTALFGIGCAWWLWRIGSEPDYVGEMLPGLLVTGIGVGLTLPSLASAAASSLPPERFATGSAVFSMSRQLGFVLGVSILVAILGSPDAANSVGQFDGGWLFMALAAGAASAMAMSIGKVGQDSGERTEAPTSLDANAVVVGKAAHEHA